MHGAIAWRRPVIGVTSYVEPASWANWRDVPAALVPHALCAAQIVGAGGLARRGAAAAPRMPTADDAREILSRFDGLIIAGGVDVEPGRYGHAAAAAGAQHPRPDRDGVGDPARPVTAAMTTCRLLGVCRGMQVMAVAAGGIAGPAPAGPAGLRPACARASGMYGTHLVRLAAGAGVGEHPRATRSRWRRTTTRASRTRRVTTRAPGRRTASSRRSRIRTATFRVGVQWHPEAGDDPRLFERLVAAAGRRSAVALNAASTVRRPLVALQSRTASGPAPEGAGPLWLPHDDARCRVARNRAALRGCLDRGTPAWFLPQLPCRTTSWRRPPSSAPRAGMVVSGA